jgi:hypothetical protein
MKKATGAGGRRKRARPADAKKPRQIKKAKLAKKKARKSKPEPAKTEFEVRQLDPVGKCGPDTSVQQLYRVDERTNGQVRTHLVFFDRHGWYCEHGRDCPAVAPARKAGIHERHTGPTHNGRMRA